MRNEKTTKGTQHPSVLYSVLALGERCAVGGVIGRKENVLRFSMVIPKIPFSFTFLVFFFKKIIYVFTP